MRNGQPIVLYATIAILFAGFVAAVVMAMISA